MKRVRKSAAVVAAASVAVVGGLAAPPAFAAAGDGVLTVEVNRDFSGDGVYEAAFDPGQAGISVTVTDGTTSETVTTDADGQADFDLAGFAGSRFRIDVAITDPDLSYLQPAPAATTATANAFRSTTTFVEAGTQTVHIGVWNPATYVPENPDVAVAQQVSRGNNGAVRSLTVTSWDNRGRFDNDRVADNVTGFATRATQAETGAVFGTAWDYRRDALFSAAYAKAYTVYGPGGSGGIYRTNTDTSATSGNTQLWATVPNAGSSVHQTITGRDDAFYAATGAEGLGGLAISEDGETLYVVNLNDQSLYSFDAAASAPAPVADVVPIADPGCVGGEWRPFAVTVRDGFVYVGGVCDASESLSRSDLTAHVLKLDGGAFTEVYSKTLDFVRGAQNYPDPVGNQTGAGVSTHWNPWRLSYDADVAEYFSRGPLYPMPILSTIAFENDGSLILGFRDRKPDAVVANGYGPDGTTATTGHYTGGDINKVCLTAGVYEWEGTGSCANNHTTANSGGEPADRVEYFPGEFFLGSIRENPTSTVRHLENSLGAVLLSPREPDVANTTMDPTMLFNTNGIGFYDRTTGEGPGNDWETRGLLVAGNQVYNFGKGNGLGSISLLAEVPPIQIGNVVWFDADHDGEQDATEVAIPGATVRLLSADGTTVLATTTTDENGEYYFGGEGGYPLEPGVDYIVEFDLTDIDAGTLPGGPALDELSFTLVEDDAAGTVHDSNAVPTTNPLIGRAPVTAPQPGGVDHSIDAGIWAGRPGIDIVKFDGREDAPANPVDGPDAVDGEDGEPTPGDWAAGVDADTEGDAVAYEVVDGSTGDQPVGMIVTNTGNLALTDVTVSDLTVEGPAVSGLTCDFSPLGGPSSGVTWEGPFEPGDSFSCSAVLEMGYEETHYDIASVVGQPVDEEGEPAGEPIGDEDGYWAVTPAEVLSPAIDIVKFDGREDAPANPVDGPDAVDGEYGEPTPGDWAAGVDADTEGDAVEYEVVDGSTGDQPVGMIVTNTGDAVLTDVTVSDLTVEGPAISGLTCDFSPLGGPSSGVTWEGPFEPGDSFSCSAVLEMGYEETHYDIASVVGQPVNSSGEDYGEQIGDEDGYWAVTPAEVLSPAIDIVKFDGREDAPQNPVDGPDAVNGEYGGETAGDWEADVDADTVDEAVEYALAGATTGAQPVGMIVTNTGDAVLTDVTVSDLTLDAPEITDLTCDFSPWGGPSSGTDWAGPFEPGDAFSCTALLELGAAEIHHDIASVVGQPVNSAGEDFGEQIGDEDGYWAVTPDAPVPSVSITKREAVSGEEADTAEDAYVAQADRTTVVEIPVVNDGATALTQVVIRDVTDAGPAMTDLTCIFPDGTTGEAADGEVRWAATFGEAPTEWQPGETIDCAGGVTLAAGQAHADTVTVTAVAPGGAVVTDENPFHVRVPAAGLAVTGGALGIGALVLATLLIGGGALLLTARARRRAAGD
ncbi:SdrD B-like domain-containing protein [Microbacterium sp. NPDC055903]